MENKLNVGNSQDILDALTGMARLSIIDGKVTVWTDTVQVDALRAAMNVERNKHLRSDVRDRILCEFQGVQYRMSAWKYSLSTNIYGYAVGDSLQSNMGGGAWSATRRGYTLSQAIVWGCNAATQKNVTFTFDLKVLPAEVVATLLGK